MFVWFAPATLGYSNYHLAMKGKEDEEKEDTIGAGRT
jgi:hypothetical protein